MDSGSNYLKLVFSLAALFAFVAIGYFISAYFFGFRSQASPSAKPATFGNTLTVEEKSKILQQIASSRDSSAGNVVKPQDMTTEQKLEILKKLGESK